MDSNSQETNACSGIVIEQIRPSYITSDFADTLKELSPAPSPHIIHSLYDVWNPPSVAVHGMPVLDKLCYVAVHEGRVIGFGCLILEHKPTHDVISPVGHIEDIVIRKDWQGKGVGTMMMRYLITVAKESGCRKLVLNCREEVSEFYRQLGFTTNEISMRLDL